MPSRYQSGDDSEYDSEAEKYLARDELTREAVIRGIRDMDRLREYVAAENQGRGREEVLELLRVQARRIREQD